MIKVEFEIENKYREVLQKYFNLDIFLESSSEVVRLNYKENNHGWKFRRQIG